MSSPRWSTPGGVPLALVVILGAALRFSTLGHQSFSVDETYTVTVLSQSFGATVAAVGQFESTPPLYYMTAWAWCQLFGGGELGLRSLSALAGVAAIPVTFAAARHFASSRGALIAAALVACNPMLVWYSQEARSYSLLVLVGALSVLLFARARERPTGRRLATWAAASAVALATHYFAVFLIAGEALLLWVAVPGRRRALTYALCGLGAVGLAMLPLALQQKAHGRATWMAAIPLSDRLEGVGLELASANVLLPSWGATARTGLAALLALAVVWGTTVLLVLRMPASERGGAGVVGALGAVAIVAPLAPLLVGLDYFFDRNLIAAWVPLAIAAGAVFGATRAGWWGGVLAGVLCLGGVAVNWEVATQPSLQRENWRAVSKALGRADGRRVIVTYPRYAQIPLEAYGQRLPRCPRVFWVRDLYLVDAFYPPRLLAPAGFRRAERIWLSPSSSERRTDRLSVMRFTAPSPVRVSRRQIARRLTRLSALPATRRELERRARPWVACQTAA